MAHLQRTGANSRANRAGTFFTVRDLSPTAVRVGLSSAPVVHFRRHVDIEDESALKADNPDDDDDDDDDDDGGDDDANAFPIPGRGAGS